MTKRCHHEFETKPDYPEDMICRKCQSIWTPQHYISWNAIELMKLPKPVRFQVLELQVEKFNRELPNYYQEHIGDFQKWNWQKNKQ